MPIMFISDINIYLLLRYYSLTTSLSYKAISSVAGVNVASTIETFNGRPKNLAFDECLVKSICCF